MIIESSLAVSLDLATLSTETTSALLEYLGKHCKHLEDWYKEHYSK